MKKFLVLLCVGCLMVGGCGQSNSKDSATESQTEVVSDAAIDGNSDVVSDAAVDVIEDTVDTVDNSNELLHDIDSGSDEWLSHIITKHSEKNTADDNTVEFFPAITKLDKAETMADTVYIRTNVYTNYKYEVEHRTFDFLTSASDTDSEFNCTYDNMFNIGNYILNEFLDENGFNSSNSVTFGENVLSSGTFRYLACVQENDGTIDTDAPFTNILVYHSIDDPNNGVTVLYVYDTPSSDSALL